MVKEESRQSLSSYRHIIQSENTAFLCLKDTDDNVALMPFSLTHFCLECLSFMSPSHHFLLPCSVLWVAFTSSCLSIIKKNLAREQGCGHFLICPPAPLERQHADTNTKSPPTHTHLYIRRKRDTVENPSRLLLYATLIMWGWIHYSIMV